MAGIRQEDYDKLASAAQSARKALLAINDLLSSIVTIVPVTDELRIQRPVDVAYEIVLRYFDDVQGRRHEGIDFGCPLGTPVMVAADGVVERAGETAGNPYGRRIRVRHIIGEKVWFTWYCHLERIDVYAGQPVRRGEILGSSGNTGNSTGPHLHFMLQEEGNKFLVPGLESNPLLFGMVDPWPFMARSESDAAAHPATLPTETR